MPADAQTSMARYVEAAELLVLLAWANHEAWLMFTRILCGAYKEPIAREWETLVFQGPEVHVDGYEVVCGSPRDARVFCELLSASTMALRVDRYSASFDTPALLELAAVIRNGSRVQEVIPVRLRLDASSFTYDGSETSIVALARQQENLERSTDPAWGRTGLRSCVRHVTKDFWPYTDVFEAFACELRDCGVRVGELQRIQLTVEEARSSFALAAHRALLGVGGQGSLRRVFVTRGHRHDEIEMLMSALAHSSSVHSSVHEAEVLFDFPQLDFSPVLKRSIQWITYALFSGYTTNAISKLLIVVGNLMPHHIEWMRELLTAADPLEVLFPDCIEGIQAFRGICVSTPCLLLKNPMTEVVEDDHACACMIDETCTELRILAQTEGWWSVFLPGWGQAWIKREQAVVSHSNFLTMRNKVRAVTQLELSLVMEEGGEQVQEFLSLIHADGRALRLSEPNGSLGNICPRVFNACPILEELTLCAFASERVAEILNSFGSGHCRHLKRLCFDFGRVDEPAHLIQQVQQVLEALADPMHSMARQLEAFDVSTVNAVAIVDLSVLDVALRMLQGNTTLTRLKLHLPIGARDMDAAQQLLSKLSTRRNALLPPRMRAPKKAAFLSAIWGTSSDQASASQHFDRFIVSAIFAFAADLRRRVVDIRMPQFVGERD